MRYDEYKGTKPKVRRRRLQDLQDAGDRLRRPAGRPARRHRLDPAGRASPRRKPTSATASSRSRRRRSQYIAFPTYVPAFARPRTCARRSPWRSTARRSSTRSSRARARRPTRSCRRSSPATARTPAASPASSTRLRPSACSTRPAAHEARWRSRTTPTVGHKEWVDGDVATSCKQNLGDRVTPGRVPSREFADLLTNVADAKGCTGPFRLGWVMDYPSIAELPGPAVLHQRLVELLRLLATRSSTTLVKEGDAAATRKRRIEKYQAGRGHPGRGHADHPDLLRPATTGAYSDRTWRTSSSTRSSRTSVTERYAG